MKEKTAMQQLIGYIENNQLAEGQTPETKWDEGYQKALSDVLGEIGELLPVERQHIEAAVDYCDKMFCDLGYVPTGKSYFTETYGE